MLPFTLSNHQVHSCDQKWYRVSFSSLEASSEMQEDVPTDCYHKVILHLHHCLHLSYEFFSVLQITLNLADILHRTQTQQTVNQSDFQKGGDTAFPVCPHTSCVSEASWQQEAHTDRCFVIKHLLSTEKN